MVGLDIYGSAAFGLGFVDFKSACIPFSRLICSTITNIYMLICVCLIPHKNDCRFGFQVISCVGKSCVLQPTDDYFNV